MEGFFQEPFAPDGIQILRQIGQNIIIDPGTDIAKSRWDQQQDRNQRHQLWLSRQAMGNFFNHGKHLSTAYRKRPVMVSQKSRNIWATRPKKVVGSAACACAVLSAEESLFLISWVRIRT